MLRAYLEAQLAVSNYPRVEILIMNSNHGFKLSLCCMHCPALLEEGEVCAFAALCRCLNECILSFQRTLVVKTQLCAVLSGHSRESSHQNRSENLPSPKRISAKVCDGARTLATSSETKMALRRLAPTLAQMGLQMPAFSTAFLRGFASGKRGLHVRALDHIRPMHMPDY